MSGKKGVICWAAASLMFVMLSGFAHSAGTVKVPDSKAAQPARRIALVIDDFGNGMSGTSDILALPVRLTVAVMPFLKTTGSDAKAAHRIGHDVIVHLPMEPVSGKKEWLGPGAITTSLTDKEIRSRVEAAIDNVPYAVGMNNHMGSRATADKRVMRVVLTVCRERGLFFLDSRTTHKSVVRETADSLGVPYASNDLFLDEQYALGHIIRQLGRLRHHIEAHETSVAIGHVGPPGKLTAQALRQAIPVLKREASFVTVASLAVGDTPKLPPVEVSDTFISGAAGLN